jgi:hypothetical protein
MSINIRFPNITANSEREQITQIKSYLHQLVDQLNYALSTLGTGDGKGQSTDAKSSGTYEVQGGEVSYYELRSLIIQELQEVEDLFDKLSQKMQNEYVRNDEVDSIAKQSAEKITFTLDEDGNLYYEVEE